MERRLRHAAATTSSATDTEWSDAEERATHRAIVFKRKIDDGAAACARGDFVTALGLYAEAIRLDPTNHVLYTNRSAIFCKLGRFDEALADAEKSLNLNPGWTKAFYRKGYALKSMGRNVAALSAYALGLAQDSRNWQLLCGLTECMAQSDMQGRFNDVFHELKYLGLEKSPFVIVSVVGQEVLNAGHLADAINILECALRIGTTSMKLRQSVLSALSTAYYNVGDWTKARQFMEEDLSIAVSLGDFFGEARTHGNLGMLALASGKLADALNHYHRQLKLFTQLDAKSQLASTFSSIGQIHRRLFDYEKALINHERCLEMLQEINVDDDSSTSLLCQQYGYIGDVRLALGRFDEAERYFMDHLELARGHDLKAEEIKALSELGATDQACGRWEEASKRYALALKLARDEKNRSAEASLCCSLATVHEARGKLETARKWADRALALALSLRDQYMEAKTCGHLAAVELKTGALENAKKLFRRQLDMATKLGDTALMMKSYRGLGVSYSSGDSSGGCLTDAIRCHKTELSLARDLGDKFSEATAHGHLGLVYAKLADNQSAATHFSCQLTLAKETKNSRLEMVATKNLGLHYSAAADSEGNAEKAVEYFEKHLMLAQENSDVDAEHVACANLGRLHFGSGHYKEAARYFGQALSLAKDLRDHRSMAKAYCDLGKVRAALDELDEALECQKYFLALAHILNDAESKLAALNNIGDVLLRSGKATVATKVFSKQLSLAKASRRKKFEAAAYGQLGRSYDVLGKNEKALALFLQELALYQQLDDIDGQYEAQGHVCDHYLLEHQVALALKALEMQAQLARDVGQPKKEADVYKRMGELCAAWNLLDDAVRYFGERRRILASKSKTKPNDRGDSTRQQASLDYARCLAAAGDDVAAVKALDEILDTLDNADATETVPESEVGLIYRDMGWCWYRLSNYERSAEAFESSLLYLAKSVVDASVKCDCYRALAAIELAFGRPESAMAQLNRQLEFIRSVGFVVEEPKTLCDLAYVLIRVGNVAKAEELIQNAIALTKDKQKNSRAEFRAMLLLATITDDWSAVIDFGSRQNNDYLLISLTVKAIAFTFKDLATAGQCLCQALDILPKGCDARLAVLVRTFSALRFWTNRDILASQEEFLHAIRLCESIDRSSRTSSTSPTLFDEEIVSRYGEICLTLAFVFFASQKMEETALVLAEKIRFMRHEKCLRAATARPVDGGFGTYDTLYPKLKAKLNDLGSVLLYFVQVEDILFSWTLTSGFRIATTHRVQTLGNQIVQDVPTPFMASLHLQFPFLASCAAHIKKLVVRDCFNDSLPAAVPLSNIFDQSMEMALAHDGRPPVIVGCDSMTSWLSRLSITPTVRLSFLPLASRTAESRPSDETVVANGLGADQSIDFGKATFIDPGMVSKSTVLSKLERCGRLHLSAKLAVDEDALILNRLPDEDEEKILRISDILITPSAATLVVIQLDEVSNDLDTNDKWTRTVVKIASSLILSGCQAVVVAKGESNSILDRFCHLLEGRSPREAIDQCGKEIDSKETSLVFFSRDEADDQQESSDTSNALRMLLQTPEECREALRVVLHLIEKALQRINAGVSNPMFTSEQSVKNKAGPEVRGCVEFLLSLGFKRGETAGSLSLNDAVYFPVQDADGSLSNGSCVVQALLGLPQTALFAFSKLLTCGDSGTCTDVLSLVEHLARELAVSTAVYLEAIVPKSIWSLPGVPELLAALGFDKMRESSDGVMVKTIRMELTRKKVAAAVTALKAIFGGCNVKRSKLAASPMSGKPTSLPRENQLKNDHDHELDLSGVESDFSSMDPALRSVVSLMKRCNAPTNGGPGVGRKRGRRMAKKGSGYLSEGEDRNKAKTKIESNQRSRGYCSEDEDRRRADDLESSITAQVISVDERSSPIASDDNDSEFPEENIVFVASARHSHEYARLETPTPFSGKEYPIGLSTGRSIGSCANASDRFGPSSNTFDRLGSSSSNGYALPRTAFPQRSPVAKAQPPPYGAVFRTSSTESACQEICGPMAMRKAVEKLSGVPTRQCVQLPPPSYGYAVRRQPQGSPPSRMPPPYGMQNRSAKPDFGARSLAGY